MIRLDKLKLFPFKTQDIYFPGVNSVETPVNFVFFPENSNFNLAYRKLRIQKRFCRYGSVTLSKVPRMNWNREFISQYMLFKLIPIRTFNPSIRNVMFDSTFYLSKLDARFRKGSYRRPNVLEKMQNYLRSVGQEWPARQNLLIYYVDTTQDLPKMPQNKRGWMLVDCFKRNEFLGFDYILICIWDGKKSIYYKIKDPQTHLPWTRVLTILNTLKHRIDSDSIEKAVEDITDDIIVTSTIDNQDLTTNQINVDNKDNVINKSEEVTNVKPLNNIDNTQVRKEIDIGGITKIKADESEDKTKRLVKRFLYNKPNLTSALKKQPITPYTSQKLILTSILTKNFRNSKLVRNAVEKIPPQNYALAINNLKKTVIPNVLEHDKYENRAREYVYCDSHIADINEHKDPSAVLNKRKIDFTVNFEHDLRNSFGLLSKNTNFPLYLKSLTSVVIPPTPGDLRPSIIRRYTAVLMDEKKREHTINIDIPEIQKDGTFIYRGSKKYMMYQLIIDPIFFLKKDEGKLQTAYATITIFRKTTKYKSYFDVYVSGYNIPLALFLMYYVGFDNMCKLFGIKYQITSTDSIDKNIYHIPFDDGTCIFFPEYTDKSKIPMYAYSLLESIKEIKTLKSTTQLMQKTEIDNMMIAQTMNRNTLFKLDQIIKNIMEPIAVEILKAKMLPTQLTRCILYMCVNIANGRVDDRNDISKQRLRCSEVMTYQIQKQILKSYSQYLMDREHGNDNAIFFCDTEQIIKRILNPASTDIESEKSIPLIRELDNANPYDELACMTMVTPTGDGGVQNVDGITLEARNIHPSYYGNVDACDTPEGGNVGVLNHLTVDALIGNSRGSFGITEKGDDRGTGSLSVCTACVPYVNHNDGCRVMFSASQGKQAIPIIGNEKPLVQTGYETIMTSMLTESHVKKAYGDGIIAKITSNSIVITLKNGQNQIIELDHPILKTSVGQIKGSLNTFRPVVRAGQKVKEGQIVAEGKHIKDGVISVGTNLLTAMMGWKGYTFEDGYVISENVAKSKFTSTSYEEREVMITQDDDVKFIASKGQFTKSGDTLLIRTSKSVEEILGMDSEEVIDGQHIIKSNGGKIIDIEIYPNISISKFPVLRAEFERFKSQYEETKGEFPKKWFNAKSGEGNIPFQGIRIVFKIERYDTCILGDKITNNHGGKGTINMIEKDENMPITPWGEKIDILFNPLAVINRMNPGTIYELYTALIAKCLARRFVQYGFNKNDKAIALASEVYRLMDNTKNKVLSTNLTNSLKALTNQQYTQFVNQIIDDNYVMPIYAPQFKEPTLQMIDQTMKFLGLKKKYYLNLPEWNTKTLEPVAVGYLYYKKLEHQAGYKNSARSTGRYNSSTGQATQGKAAGGGQRVGEMDTWCLISHGVTNTLKEIMGGLADDMKTKNEMVSDIINNGYTNYKEPKSSPSTERLKIYLAGTMIETDI